jgi:hypothetical protein
MHLSKMPREERRAMLVQQGLVRTEGQLVRVAMDGSWDAAQDLLKRLPEPRESSEQGPSDMLFGSQSDRQFVAPGDFTPRRSDNRSTASNPAVDN